MNNEIKAVTAYNHSPVDGTAGTKPLIPNQLFKEALEAAQAGDIGPARRALLNWGMDTTQKNLLNDYLLP